MAPPSRKKIKSGMLGKGPATSASSSTGTALDPVCIGSSSDEEEGAVPQVAAARAALPSGAAAGEEISAFEWLQFMLGGTEEQMIADRARFIAPLSPAPGGGGTFAFRGATGSTWPAGGFEWPSVGELRSRAVAALGTARRARPPLVVADGVDIGRLQAELTTEDAAMVQVASNFNALENASRTTAADFGFLVSGYATDSTQGPAASFGVPAASLLRAHYPFYQSAKQQQQGPDMWGQTAERQVELLAGVPDVFGRCVNGKVTLTGSEVPIGGEPEALAGVADRIRVGVHTDAQVVFGRGSGQGALRVLAEGARPLVDQVISASVNLRDPRGGGQAPNRTELVRACLRAAYHGAYLAAIVRGRKLLLLTLVGGGSFGDPHDPTGHERLILEAIADAHATWAHLSALDEVRLCLYPDGAAAACQVTLDELLAAAPECPELAGNDVGAAPAGPVISDPEPAAGDQGENPPRLAHYEYSRDALTGRPGDSE